MPPQYGNYQMSGMKARLRLQYWTGSEDQALKPVKESKRFRFQDFPSWFHFYCKPISQSRNDNTACPNEKTGLARVGPFLLP